MSKFVPTDEQINRAVASLGDKVSYIVRKQFKRAVDQKIECRWFRVETNHGETEHKGVIIDLRVAIVDDDEHYCCVGAAFDNVPGFGFDDIQIVDEAGEQSDFH